MSLALRGIRLAPAWMVPRHYIVRRGDRRCGRIALTFDDGPNPAYTPRILDLLDAHEIKATFFLLGREAERHPHLAREVVRRGHDVGNHTYSHANLTSLPPHLLREEIDRGRAVVEGVTGMPVSLLRPPGGYMGLRAVAHAAWTGMTVVLWSVDSQDWMRLGQESIREAVNPARVTLGDIVLLHDDYPETVAALPAVLDDLGQSGLTSGTLGDLLVDATDRR